MHCAHSIINKREKEMRWHGQILWEGDEKKKLSKGGGRV